MIDKLAIRIKNERTASGLTQGDLAKKTGLIIIMILWLRL